MSLKEIIGKERKKENEGTDKGKVKCLRQAAEAMSKQAVIVTVENMLTCQAVLSGWEDVAGCGWQMRLPARAVTVGKAGVTSAQEKIEGDNKTPLGMYFFGSAFGYALNPGISWPYRQVTEFDCWVDDPDSPAYNCWRQKDKIQAKSFELLCRDDHLYECALIIEYNTFPVVAGKGSAIFAHVWRSPGTGTAGCVAMSRESIQQLFTWLQPENKPVICFALSDKLAEIVAKEKG